MTTVEVNGTRLACRIERSGEDAPWVVFGNSLVTDLSIWDAQAAALAGRCNVLRYGQRGHGESEVPLGPVDFDMLGADLLALMDHAGAARAVYVGLSMGVPTGLAAVAQAPERFEALVFSDGQAKSAPTARETWGERIKAARASGMQALAAATAGRWMTEGAGHPRYADLVTMIAATPFDGFAACATALQSYDYAEAVSKLPCPALFVAGTEDGAMPETMRKLADAAPDARFEGIPAAGHVPCFERPWAFNAALMEFLRARGILK